MKNTLKRDFNNSIEQRSTYLSLRIAMANAVKIEATIILLTMQDRLY